MVKKRVLTPPKHDWVYPESDFAGLPDEPEKKIAIAGAYPEHRDLAPYEDPSWEIWAWSAGMWGQKLHRRWDKWFELHAPRTYDKYERIAKGYIEFITREAIVQTTFPYNDLLEEFGPYFLTTGQVPWLLAYAITLEPDVIGIWGVEAAGEYTPQRKDVHHFVQVARDRGIKIVIPEKCTLLDKPKLYAFSSL